MSEPLCEVGKLRVCPEAHAILHAEASVRGDDCTAIALVREIVEQWALGRAHRLTVLAKRMERAGLSGAHRDE